jgi:hypothetical protein
MAEKYSLKVNFVMPRHEIQGTTLTGVQPGETLEGEALLTTYEDINCRGVWLEIGYHDRGSGTPNDNRLFQTMFYEGKLQANKPLTHLFRFTIPETGPVSYEGQIVKIEWYVRIRIDIPFWFDKREEFPFNVIPTLVTTENRAEVQPRMEKLYGKNSEAINALERILNPVES